MQWRWEGGPGRLPDSVAFELRVGGNPGRLGRSEYLAVEDDHALDRKTRSQCTEVESTWM